MTKGQTLTFSDTDKLSLLLNVSRLISSRLELKPLFGEVTAQAARLVSAHRTTLYLYEAEREELYTLVGGGLDREIRLSLGQGVAGAAAKLRQTLIIPDAYKSEYFDPIWDDKNKYLTKSLLAVPMISQDRRLLGCFQAVNRLHPRGTPIVIPATGETLKVAVFSDDDVELLSALTAIATVAVENAMLYEEQKRQFNSFIVTLAQSVDARDATTSSHTRLVTGIAVAIARQMGLGEQAVERVRIAAVLHDYGKIGVPDNVLNKPGELRPKQRQLMHSHCIKTILILSRIAFRRDLRDIPQLAGMHHEWLDGSGYPFGLKAEEIPLEGRILAVADVFQALTQTRPYKDGMPPERALATCFELAGPHQDNRSGEPRGTQLDVNVVTALSEVLQACTWEMSYFEGVSGWEQMLSGELV